MSTYAVGDVQGCYDQLLRLLDKLDFNPAVDRLWMVGDLVNRGPHSLQTVRFVKSLGTRATTVLGNHDLHLLAQAEGLATRKKKDTLATLMEAPDAGELLTWLRRQPLLHHEDDLGYTMVHAGLPPQWDLAQASACAGELETMLRGPDYREFLKRMYGNQPDRWNPKLKGWSRLRFITNCFTRLRYCNQDGRLDLVDKGTPGSQRPGNLPWFLVPGRASADLRIIFGHWSTLALAGINAPGVYPLDTGCIWGGQLTALHLETGRYTRILCPEVAEPKVKRRP